jgi:hypothetical protein
LLSAGGRPIPQKEAVVAKEWKPGPDQVAALNVLVGYCCKEIYAMGAAFPKGHMCQLAAMEVLALAGLSWPQFLSEHAQELGTAALDG